MRAHGRLRREVTLVLVQGLGELVDSRRDLDTLLEDGTLALDAHVARPLHVSAKVPFRGKHISADAEIPRVLREQVLVLRLPVLRFALLGLFGSGSNLSLRLNKQCARDEASTPSSRTGARVRERE